VYRFNSNSGSVNISSVTIAPPSGTSFTERLMAPLPEVVDEPEDDQVEWVADESIMSDDGHAIWVNEHGLDEAGYDPRAPGYRVGLCNCDDCRQVRIDDADVEDDGTDYDYEEDEE
jgi:predicted amidohydrolase YtcJ